MKYKIGDKIKYTCATNPNDNDIGVIVSIEGERYWCRWNKDKDNKERYFVEGNESFTLYNARPHAELIKAWADGAEIQCNMGDGQWLDTSNPMWDQDYQYRIKPQLKLQKQYVAVIRAHDGRENLVVINERDWATVQNLSHFVRWAFNGRCEQVREI